MATLKPAAKRAAHRNSTAGTIGASSAPAEPMVHVVPLGGQLVRMASGERVLSYRLTDPAVADRVATYRAKILSSPEQATKFLKQVGTLNRSGKLSKKFGG